MRLSLQRFHREEAGIASVEFALLGSVLLLLLAGGFDLVYMVGSRRDANRASMLIARAMVTCTSSSCMSDTSNNYVQREANALVRYPQATIKIYMVQRQNSQIQTCSSTGSSGTQLLLTDSDVIASAKNIMRDNDVGAVVILTTSYTSILPKALMNYISSAGANYRDYAVDVMGNVGTIC